MFKFDKSGIVIGGKIDEGGGSEVNNQDKTVTENGIYTADAGYTGLGTVTVDVPSSGGDVVNAKNYTGSTVSTGDKVWLKYDAQLAGANADETTTAYNIYPCLSADGKCFTYAVSDNTTGIKYINSIDDADFSIVTSSGLYQGSNYTPSYPFFVRYTDDNKLIRNAYDHIQLIGQNWWQNNKNYIGYDLAVDYSWNNVIYILDMANGAITSSIVSDTNTQGRSTIAVSENVIYSFYSGKYVTINRTAGTVSSASLTQSGTVVYFNTLGVTKDKKFIIGCSEKSSETNQTLVMVEILSPGVVNFMNAQEVIPEMQYWMSHSAPYAFTFNQNTGVLCCAELNSKKYGFYRYDSTTHKWSVLDISLAGALDGIDVFYGQITVDENLSRAMVAYKPSGSSAIYSRLFALRSEIGFSAIAYDWADISPSMFSGKVVTGGASQENIEVATVLPDELTVNVTVNIDNAEISGGIE